MLSRLTKGMCALQAFHVFVAVGSSCSVFTVSAAEWRLTPFVELSETYTDNIALQPAGQEETEYVTQLNPGFTLTGNGRRLDLSFSYRLQNLLYAKLSDRNNSNHQLLASMDAELLREFIFFDASASLRQQLVDPEGDIGQGNIAISGNREDVATFTLSPYVEKRLGNWLLAEVRYTRDSVRSLDRISEDSVADAISGQLVGAKPTDRWSWQLGFSSRNVEYTTGLRPSERREYVDFTVDYRLSRKLDVNGSLGYEDHEYEQALGAAAPKGEYWNVGLSWRPTPRTNMVLGRGKRYFGPVWSFDLVHRTRRSTISGGYLHDLSSRRQYMLEVPVFDPDGNPIIYPDTSEQVIGRIPIDEVFLRRRAHFGMDFRMLKSTTSLNVYTEYRDYQRSGREEDVNGGSLAWLWDLNRRDSFTFTMNAQLIDVIGEYLDRLTASHATLERKFSRRATAALEARQTKRARGGDADYVENMLTARLTLDW